MKHRNHSAAFLLFFLGVAVLTAFGYEAGLERSLVATSKLLAFARDQIVTALFLLVAGLVVWWVIRLNLSDDPEKRNFELWKLLAHPDGSPDPKKISLWMATLAGMYAFFYLLMHDRAAFTAFSNWFLLTLFGYAGVIEVFAKKEPPPPPGTITDTIKHTREVSPAKPPLEGV